MIKELINFTESLDEDFKNLGLNPKEGLHVSVKKEIDSLGVSKIVVGEFEYFSKKQKNEISTFLKRCMLLHQNAWCIDTNKCFDLPTKAIHTCSPYAVAFKREHLEGGIKYKNNQVGKKKQIYDRFNLYFDKAFELFEDEGEKEKYISFRNFFTHKEFSNWIDKIENQNAGKYQNLLEEEEQLKSEYKETKDKVEKDTIKKSISEIEQQLLKVKPLEDSSYIIFYFDVPLEQYKEVHKRYLDDKLFNTDKYNTEPDENGIIHGTNNFMNGFNSNMPFLMHQTATFDITGRISNVDAQLLNNLKNLFPNKTLPSPLPIFIYKEELQQRVISIYKESGYKAGYKEIIQKLIEDNEEDIYNYYLLFWQNTKDGVVFRDFDFVSKFEYKIKDLAVHNLFQIKEKGSKVDKYYPRIKNIFEFEQLLFKPLLQNKYLRLDYFGDLSKDDYEKHDLVFISYSKYRKSVYDFVYKSQRNTIDGNVFYEMVFNAILDNLKNGNSYGIKEKLNIWYSLYEYFNPKQNINMINKLKEYQDFVESILHDKELTDITDEKFAFAAGQVIEYILSKSKSADSSYNLLEPYLQQSKCVEFKKAIANDFGRYKHENFSKNFEKVAAVVLSYETDTNLKHLLPQTLSGVFAKNQLFSSNNLK
ncbi:hypothetical protein NBRC110019_32100 [Neptunitalea chrysea]|uniref:CRISPR-associated protein Csh1 n=1 Tax=Neptunitalea chrysea TaxID=1647581 RepID=A0A9W6EVS3_9FLAO|nr:hypothetical protein [Neptunitalea chrysea]GLB54169.1 hypothetical protein NBRC110019_32100 [Neptunitalea chrysea]